MKLPIVYNNAYPAGCPYVIDKPHGVLSLNFKKILCLYIIDVFKEVHRLFHKRWNQN